MKKTTRGRPRKVDPEVALTNVMHTFWAKGYDATSMSDLVEATGMAKPGLYANFGDKEKLYQKALENYVSFRRKQLMSIFETSDLNAKETFRLFFNKMADALCSDEEPGGCFLVNTLMKSENNEPAIRKQAQTFNNMRKSGYLGYLKRAQKEGKLAKGNDLDQLAEFLSAQTLTLATLQKIGSDKKELVKFIDTFLTIFKE